MIEKATNFGGLQSLAKLFFSRGVLAHQIKDFVNEDMWHVDPLLNSNINTGQKIALKQYYRQAGNNQSSMCKCVLRTCARA